MEAWTESSRHAGAARDELDAVLAGLLDQSRLRHVVMRARQIGVSPATLLAREGWLTPDAYARAMARRHNVRLMERADEVPQGSVAIDATGAWAEDVASEILAARLIGREPMLFVGAKDRDVGPDERLAEAAVSDAIEALRTSAPVMSAGRRMWMWQYMTLALVAGIVLGVSISLPGMISAFFLVSSAGIFAGVAVYRLLLLSTTVLGTSRCHQRLGRFLGDDDLPNYSVLVPLFREAAVLPDLVDALAALDYPRAKLDVVLILEESDLETRSAAGRLMLPPFMRVIVVPDRQPRTKPKALNTALALTRGELIAVYDAEDVPEPDQLRKAAAAFAGGRRRLVCVQARLAIYNPRQSWITRQFALEYAMLFHTFLPALRLLRLPMPLSGTSNHFRRSAIENSAWDPFNVTEDADLGMRLAREGGEIGLIDSSTLEEAPYSWGLWLPQRTRWIKGWMQTYLVHTRQPWRLYRELGLWQFLGFHALFGGFLLSVLAYPVMLVFFAAEAWGGRLFETEVGTWHHLALVVALIDLIAGVVAALAMMLVGAWRGRLAGLAGDIAAAPLYWLLISVAGYRALAQLIWKPHLWEKTEHSARRRRRA